MGLQYGDCPLMGGGTGESFESCDSEELRNSRHCETQWYPYREKVGQRRRHVTNNGEALMTS